VPRQLFGYGRSDRSSKLIRGLGSEAAAGFRSRRGRYREPTPVIAHYAPFASYKTARVHRAHRRRGCRVAIRCANTALRAVITIGCRNLRRSCALSGGRYRFAGEFSWDDRCKSGDYDHSDRLLCSRRSNRERHAGDAQYSLCQRGHRPRDADCQVMRERVLSSRTDQSDALRRGRMW